MEIVEFIRQQLDEDERLARAVVAHVWAEDSAWLTDMLDPLPSQRREHPGWQPMITPEDVAHIARWDPARVLREVEAAKRILVRHEPIEVFGQLLCVYCGVTKGASRPDASWPCPDLRDLALAYADSADYREEWRIDG